MKTPLIAVGILMTATACVTSMRYSVALRNHSSSNIRVRPMEVTSEERGGTFAPGEVMSGGTASMGSYFRMPVASTRLSWTEQATTQEFSAVVNFTPPPRFTRYRQYPKIIWLDIQTNRQVTISYDVWDNKAKDFVTVDSQGNEIE